MGRSEPVDLRTARTRGGGRSDAARARRRGEGSTGLLPPRRRKLSSNDGTPPHLLDRLVRSSAGRRRGAVERLEAHSSTARAAASRGFRSLVDASWRLRTQGGRRAVMHLERRLGTQARWSGTLSGGPGRAEAARTRVRVSSATRATAAAAQPPRQRKRVPRAVGHGVQREGRIRAHGP